MCMCVYMYNLSPAGRLSHPSDHDLALLVLILLLVFINISIHSTSTYLIVLVLIYVYIYIYIYIYLYVLHHSPFALVAVLISRYMLCIIVVARMCHATF